MLRKKIYNNTLLNINNSIEGETIEMKIERIVNNKEPISDNAPLIYTERKDGVQPDFDIRTDKWEYAIEGMDKVTKSKLLKREEFYKKKEETSVNTTETKQTSVQNTANTSTT